MHACKCLLKPTVFWTIIEQHLIEIDQRKKTKARSVCSVDILFDFLVQMMMKGDH